MAEEQYLMGVDFGTGGVRVGLFDAEGTPKVFHGVEWETAYPRSGWAEQDPDAWWQSFLQAARRAVSDSGVPAESIVGIATDATASTVLAVGDDDRHLRPAIMWMDVRASDQAERIAATHDRALKYSGYGDVSAEWGLPKALWIKEREPEVFERAKHLCDCNDWLVHRLTGEWASSINIASAKFFYDRDEGGWPESLLRSLDFRDFLEKFPKDVLDLGAVVGGLRKSVAEEIGLKEGTPVAQGAIDAYAGALGLGVVEPGTLGLITGSSHVMIGQSAHPIHGQGFWGSYTDAMIPGQYTVEAGQASTGSVVAWFKNNFAGEAAREAERRGCDTYDVLNELAEKVPIGSDGLIFLDYFQGNRSPHTDPLVRGAVWGLSLGHGPGHIFRSIIEGICFGTEEIFRAMRGHDFEPRLNVVSGGPTKSALWMQMHADVSNLPIALTKVSEGPVLGAAMLASVGAGVYKDVREAAQNMVHTESTVEPDAEAHEKYRFYLDRYTETYPRMKDLMHRMSRHEAGAAQG
ncbi:Ribulose kinase (plasmid) [Rubrobacter radiotolerans]|uniref:FGGY family carbohydrate kinase n=1 Tax=Rubrobacter radiotolerans TaxID=42256 RepID=A0A023X8E2_RUBRA|nr:FGGY family carbohydrate kinase [Rubrobacter radiotolerans]AHY48315.1 Ribulose kinase [Rubrobacter radiotolerans]MDX5895588.1 FGGY family carbohydrate kinase [Rubrobacter radiotolerans]